MRKVVMAAVVSVLIAASTAAYAYQGGKVSNGGTITGTVKYEGTPPKRARLEITKDISVCGGKPVYDPSLIVAKDGAIANVVVTLPDIAKGEPFKPLKDVVFDQIHCEYTPHVAVFPAGSTLKIVNSDGILHSIHTESKINPVIDMAQPGFKKTITVTIKHPEIIKVNCDAHNWMQGWWYVVDNPYYSITGAEGHFTIKNVPPGTYVLKAWQEKLGTMTQKVTVKAGATTKVEFLMKPAKG